MCPEITRNLMYDCYLDLVLGVPPKDENEFLDWIFDLDARIYTVLIEIGCIPLESDDLMIGECLV